jgi:hypothetical protein
MRDALHVAPALDTLRPQQRMLAVSHAAHPIDAVLDIVRAHDRTRVANMRPFADSRP